MYILITPEIRQKAKLWRLWEIKMLNMRISEFNLCQIKRWGIKNLNAYNILYQHIEWLTQIIWGRIRYLKI